MSATYATIHATQDLIHALQNPAPVIPLVTLVNSHKEALISLAKIFGKVLAPEIPPSMPARGALHEKLQQVNQELTRINNASQYKSPFTNIKPLRVIIV